MVIPLEKIKTPMFGANDPIRYATQHRPTSPPSMMICRQDHLDNRNVSTTMAEKITVTVTKVSVY